MEVEYLVSEHNKILVIDGHVDLDAALIAFKAECDDPKWPLPTHSYMRWTDVPDGEFAENWREVCKKDDLGAEAVTLSILEW